MTPATVRALYFRDRDEHGRIKLPKKSGKRLSMAEVERAKFDHYWRQRGMRPDVIEKLWNDLHG